MYASTSTSRLGVSGYGAGISSGINQEEQANKLSVLAPVLTDYVDPYTRRMLRETSSAFNQAHLAQDPSKRLVTMEVYSPESGSKGKHLRTRLTSKGANLRVQALKLGMSLTDDKLKLLADIGLPALQKLSLLSRCATLANVQVFAKLGQFKHLSAIHLGVCMSITTEHLRQLAKLTTLTHLAMTFQDRPSELIDQSACTHHPVDFGVLSALSLKYLAIEDSSQMNAHALEALSRSGAASSALETLNIPYSMALDDSALAYLANFKQLTGLHLAGCSGISGAGLAPMTALKQLRSLNLSRCQNIDDQAAPTIAGFRALKELAINDTSISPAGTAQFSGLNQLVKLIAHGNRPSGPVQSGRSDLRWLASMPNLHTLMLAACEPVNALALASIARLTALTRLELMAIQQGDVQQLVSLRNLEHLELTQSPAVNDQVLTKLAHSMRNLTSLNLAGTSITDAGINALANHPKLNNIGVEGCQQVSDDRFSLEGKEGSLYLHPRNFLTPMWQCYNDFFK